MINQELKEKIKTYQEENRYDELKLCFRYNDLNRNAQIKLVKLLKKYSRNKTIRTTITNQQIDEALLIGNPPIFTNNWHVFTGDQFPSWREKKLSKLIYYLNKKTVSIKTKNSILNSLSIKNTENN